ncbi:MAG: protein kinase [Polyangiaceae bacterium]|nr:protein kinase [Polyangiaceae bacterium]
MDSPDLSGLTLGGRYLLVRRIGAGGMGAVYEARESTLGRRIAVKVLHAAATDGETLDRFRREAQVLASLSHVHIVQVSDFQLNLGEPPFLVMEYLEGRSLGDLVREAPLPPLRVAALAVQVLSALTAAHVAGIIHRDIKPDNIFVVPSPTLGDVVKVLDFGIAKLFGSTQEALTREGTLLGTLPYMSPEQAAGEPLDPRTDLYSLAVCMYRACSGALPIDEPSLAGMLRSIISGAIPRLSSRMLVDPIFADIVHRALCRDRDGRFADAAAMASALEGYLRHALRGEALPLPLAATEERTAASPRVDASPLEGATWRPPSSAPMAAVALPRALPPASRSSPSRLPLALGGLGAALGVAVLGWSLFTAAGRARLAPPMVRAVSGATASWTELPPESSALVSRRPLRGPSPAQSPTGSIGPVGPLARACTDASQCAQGATCRDGACECPWRNIVCAAVAAWTRPSPKTAAAAASAAPTTRCAEETATAAAPVTATPASVAPVWPRGAPTAARRTSASPSTPTPSTAGRAERFAPPECGVATAHASCARSCIRPVSRATSASIRARSAWKVHANARRLPTTVAASARWSVRSSQAQGTAATPKYTPRSHRRPRKLFRPCTMRRLS